MADIAYAARYGNQPISELLAMTSKDFYDFVEALEDLVIRENGKPQMPDEEY